MQVPQGFRKRKRLCSLCVQEMLRGEEYWICNGLCICSGCLASYARAELVPYRQICGREMQE